MKATGFLFSLILFSLSNAFAQSEAQTSFDKLKGLAGTWEGVATTIPPMPGVDGKTVQVFLRVTSMGNALMHEMKVTGQPDNPITMLYLEGDRLLLTHYCDAGNRPNMAGKMAADGKTVTFDVFGVSGRTQQGYMHNASFTPISPDHHEEEWTFIVEGKPPMKGHLDLRLKKSEKLPEINVRPAE